MKTKFFVLSGALLMVAGIAAFLAHKPMTAREELILRNVEAIAQVEQASTEDCNAHCESSEKDTCILLFDDGTWKYCPKMRAK